jgi:hypothetical protein
MVGRITLCCRVFGRSLEATKQGWSSLPQGNYGRHEEGREVPPSKSGRRRPPRMDRQLDCGKITALATVIIQVGGRILQTWIERGGHL